MLCYYDEQDKLWHLEGVHAGAAILLMCERLDRVGFPSRRAALEALWVALDRHPLRSGSRPAQVVKVRPGVWETAAGPHALFERRDGAWHLQRAPMHTPVGLLARSWPTLRAARLAYAGWADR